VREKVLNMARADGAHRGDLNQIASNHVIAFAAHCVSARPAASKKRRAGGGERRDGWRCYRVRNQRSYSGLAEPLANQAAEPRVIVLHFKRAFQREQERRGEREARPLRLDGFSNVEIRGHRVSGTRQLGCEYESHSGIGSQ